MILHVDILEVIFLQIFDNLSFVRAAHELAAHADALAKIRDLSGAVDAAALARHAFNDRLVNAARTQQHERLSALDCAGALEAAHRHIKLFLREHLLHSRRHAARRGEVLAIDGALLHIGCGNRLRINVLCLEHGVQLFKRHGIIRAFAVHLLIALDLALLGDARPDKHDLCAGVNFLDEARRRHHRRNGVAHLAHEIREVLFHHVVKRRTAAGGHAAALPGDFLGLLGFIIGRGIRADRDLHHVIKAEQLDGLHHFAHAHAAELAFNRRRKAGIHFQILVLDIRDDIRNHRYIGNRAKRTGNRAVSAGDALGIVDGCAAVALIHGNRINRAGAHAGTARVCDGVVRAGLRTHAALAALVGINNRAVVRHGNRIKVAGLHALLRNAVLAVAGHGVTLKRAALTGAVHDGNRFVRVDISVISIDGRLTAGPCHAVSENFALPVYAAAIRRLTAVRNDFQRNKIFMFFQCAFVAVLGNRRQNVFFPIDFLVLAHALPLDWSVMSQIPACSVQAYL